ncbi:MAG TPA: hypothetical protein VIH37_06220 [Candidatus Limnocylindrales bacterium]
MRARATVLALAVVAALLASACGGSSATAAPTTASGPGPSASAIPGVGALIPADDGYETFDVFGQQGTDAVNSVRVMNPEDVHAILAANGKTADDFSYAVATGSQGTVVTAAQIAGLPATQYVKLIPGASTVDLTKERVGGKDVLASENANSGIWIYLTGDQIFVVHGTKDAAAALFQTLP